MQIFYYAPLKKNHSLEGSGENIHRHGINDLIEHGSFSRGLSKQTVFQQSTLATLASTGSHMLRSGDMCNVSAMKGSMWERQPSPSMWAPGIPANTSQVRCSVAGPYASYSSNRFQTTPACCRVLPCILPLESAACPVGG